MPNNIDYPLKGKKILFFAPAFFNYEEIIKDKMVEMGATAYLYDERSVKSAFFRHFSACAISDTLTANRVFLLTLFFWHIFLFRKHLLMIY